MYICQLQFSRNPGFRPTTETSGNRTPDPCNFATLIMINVADY